MLKSLTVIAFVLFSFVGSAAAYQCPLLVKQLTDGLATRDPSDPKTKLGQQLIAEAKALHEAGRHAESIATAQKAARVLGLSLKLAPLTPAQEEQIRAAEQKIGK
jgi:hypothetical protein